MRLYAGMDGRLPRALMDCSVLQCKPGPEGPDRFPALQQPHRGAPAPALLAAGGRDLRRHFVGEVVDLLLDAFPDDVKGEALDGRVGSLEHLLDGLLVVLDEGL